MNTANKASHPFKLIKVVIFELSAADRREQRKSVISLSYGVMVQRVTVYDHRGSQRDFVFN